VYNVYKKHRTQYYTACTVAIGATYWKQQKIMNSNTKSAVIDLESSLWSTANSPKPSKLSVPQPKFWSWLLGLVYRHVQQGLCATINFFLLYSVRNNELLWTKVLTHVIMLCFVVLHQPPIVYIVKGLNATFNYFVRKQLSSNGYGWAFQCKNII